MVLLKKGDPNACRIKNLQGNMLTQPIKLEFSSHPGLAMIYGGDCYGGQGTYMLIGYASSQHVMNFLVSGEKTDEVKLQMIGKEDRYMELPGGDIRERNFLWLRTWHNDGHKGLSFAINKDGTISPYKQQGYAFGLEKADKNFRDLVANNKGWN